MVAGLTLRLVLLAGPLLTAGCASPALRVATFGLGGVERPHVWGARECACARCDGPGPPVLGVDQPETEFARLWAAARAAVEASGVQGAALEYQAGAHALVVTGDERLLDAVGALVARREARAAPSRPAPR